MPGSRPSQMTSAELDYAIKHRKGQSQSGGTAGTDRPSHMSKEQLHTRVHTRHGAPDAETPASREPNKATPPASKSRWERIKEGARRVGRSASRINDKVQARHAPKKATREARPRRRQVSRVDRYSGGQLVESIHYGPMHPPRSGGGKQQRRSDPFGGIGAGMSFGDFMPNTPQAPSSFMSSSHSSPTTRRGKRARRAAPQQDYGFDFLDHMNSVPW
jgi:hypothetical protein